MFSEPLVTDARANNGSEQRNKLIAGMDRQNISKKLEKSIMR